MNERVLHENDIYELLAFINSADRSYRMFTDFSVNKGHFSEISIRNNFFTYAYMGYGQFVDNKMTALALFLLPKILSNLKSATIELLKTSDVVDEHKFVTNSVKALFDNNDDVKKVKINFLENKDEETLRQLMCSVGFQNELVLNREIDGGFNLAVYSNYR